MKCKKSKQVITIEPRLFVDGEMYQINDIVEVTKVDGNKVLGRISDIEDDSKNMFCGIIKACIKVDASKPYKGEVINLPIDEIVQIKNVESVKA